MHRHATLVFVFLVLALAVRDVVPPGDLGVTPESVARMRADLEVIARETRPAGSSANVAAREYLRDQLLGLGLAVQEQLWYELDRELVNIVTRIPGENPEGALLVLAHHDSVTRGPGAADDGVGCVAILELARELVAGPPLAQDVLLLLTDGEEIGMLGARTFRDAHPAMADVRAVINIEAMGGAGPLVCFQMSQDNADLARAWARTPHATGSSFAEVVYSLMPNNTDLTRFLGRAPGINLALAGGCSVYHKPWDTPERVEDRALAHTIATLSSLTRSVAGGPWPDELAPARNWFSVPFVGVLDWSETPTEWGLLSVLGLLVVLDAPGTRSRRALAILRGILLAFGLLFVALLPAFALGFIFLYTRSGLTGPTSYGEVHAMVALQGLWVAALLVFLGRWSARRPERAELVLEASLGALLVASLAGLFYFVERLGLRGSDALLLRAACTASAFAFLAAQRTHGGGRWIVAVLLLAPVLTFAPFLAILPQIGSQLEWLAAAMGAALWALLCLLLLPLLVRHADRPVTSPR